MMTSTVLSTASSTTATAANRQQKQHDYALVCLDRVSYVTASPLEPADFVQHILPIKEVLNIASRKHFQIWHRDGMWYPVYGAEGQLPVVEIVRPNREDCETIQEQEFTELGKKAIKLYMEWRRRSKLYARQIVRRSEVGQSCDHLIAEKASLDRNIEIIDDIVSTFPLKGHQELFDLRFRKEYEQEKIVHLLHYSSSTVNRYTLDIKRLIGTDLHNHLSNADIEEKFHLEWPRQAWRFGRNRDI